MWSIKIILISVLYLLFLSFPSVVRATNYYVANGGSDSNSGTIDEPWETLSKAGSTAQAGDTVYFRSGTYNGTLSPSYSGTSDAWITFSSYPGETAYIVGDSNTAVNIKTLPADYTDLPYENAKSYIEISGFDITSVNHGIAIEEAHHIRVLNNNVHDNDHAGITAPDGTDHLLVQGNTVSGNANGVGPCGSGISVWNSGCFWGEDSDCEILDDGATGYHIIIKENTIYSNRNDDSSCGFPNPSDGNGIILDNNGDSMPLTLIANNLIYHNGGRCIQSLNSDNAHIINNTCWENLQTERMQNNGSGEILLDQHEVSGATMTFDNLVFKNNVIYGRGDGCPWQAWGLSESGYDSDYNLWYQDDVDGDYNTDWSNILDNYRSCIWNHGSSEIIGSDPLFVSTPTCTGSDPYYNCDWESDDFRLQQSSPLVDSGTSEYASVVSTDFIETSRPQASGYDIGAYEYITSSTPSTTPSTPGPASPQICTNISPLTSPDLFQINLTNVGAKIYCAPALGNIDRYYIAYSNTNENAEEHGVELLQGYSSGVLSFDINLLKPYTTYYFKIRAGNGCMPGPWSNILSAKTTIHGALGNKYYRVGNPAIGISSLNIFNN